ncbi:unnamed protein product [Meganyctiphanes norvegica]|uniref:NADH dehydrogenase subunit 4L n=1 Tax=Meganyctiphanes norvegica TaxID=48144 RepID=A0AAV2SPR8_MEGNR
MLFSWISGVLGLLCLFVCVCVWSLCYEMRCMTNIHFRWGSLLNQMFYAASGSYGESVCSVFFFFFLFVLRCLILGSVVDGIFAIIGFVIIWEVNMFFFSL